MEENYRLSKSSQTLSKYQVEFFKAVCTKSGAGSERIFESEWN